MIIARNCREELYTDLLRECALKIPRKQDHWRRNVISKITLTDGCVSSWLFLGYVFALIEGRFSSILSLDVRPTRGGLQFRRGADFDAVISANDGPRDGLILKFHPNAVAVVRQLLAINHIRGGRFFPHGGYHYFVTDLPGV